MIVVLWKEQPLTSTWPHLNSDIGLEEGGILTELSLCYSRPYCVTFQQCTLHNHNQQFFQVGLLDQALISLGLALSPPSTSVSSDFMVLCKCF